MFGKLKDLAESGKALSFGDAFFSVFSEKEVKQEVIYLNTEDQLFTDGINSEGVELTSIGGSYAPFTIMIKQEQGLPFMHVTLFDSGDFYGSFNIIADKDGFTIEADSIKEGKDLQDRWGSDILGLTEPNIESLAKMITPFLVNYMLNKLLE